MLRQPVLFMSRAVFKTGELSHQVVTIAPSLGIKYLTRIQYWQVCYWSRWNAIEMWLNLGSYCLLPIILINKNSVSTTFHRQLDDPISIGPAEYLAFHISYNIYCMLCTYMHYSKCWKNICCTVYSYQSHIFLSKIIAENINPTCLYSYLTVPTVLTSISLNCILMDCYFSIIDYSLYARIPIVIIYKSSFCKVILIEYLWGDILTSK